MQLSEYSRSRCYRTFSKWDVPSDFAEPVYNYLVYGWNPGSCFTAVLANDFARAMASSHPSNSITAFKALVGWLTDHMPHEAWGSYALVDSWSSMDESKRRLILERAGLVHTAQEETWLAIKGDPILDAELYGL